MRPRLTQTVAIALTAVAALALLATPVRGATTQSAKIDLLFALDTTGSMSDEIALVRRLVWDLANGLISGARGAARPSIRLGLVRYRDTRDTYVVKVTPLTFDLDAVHKQLMHTRANGGGDTPEHVNLGLHKALDQKWRAGATRLVFLIGDAKPKQYGDYFHDKEARRARKLGVKVHTIGCSGLSTEGIAIFKTIARLSGGAYADLPRSSSRRGSTSDRRLRNLILRRANLMRYVSNTPVSSTPRVGSAAKRSRTKRSSSDPHDRRYAPTPDRIWRTTIH
jgi:Mg-chelatase subunit ChlD